MNATIEAVTFVTGNAGKVAELRELLDPLGIAVIPDDRGYPEIQHDTLRGVTEAGAGYLLATGLEPPFLLEDAGLFVDDLRDWPGVYSRHAFDALGCDGLLQLMQGRTNRTASFLADLCFVDHHGDPHHFEGECRGTIANEVHGSGGFGYDPVFIPDDADGRTFAEMDAAQKTALSHRGQAVRAFVLHLEQTRKT